jgi:Spy/CpxP family protein refolding chaperone
MKQISHAIPLISTMLVAAALAGCAAAAPRSDAHDHAKSGAMDMQSHCEMHKKMMGAKPSAEQQAMMQEHMKSMAPEMRQRMQAMHEQCK